MNSEVSMEKKLSIKRVFGIAVGVVLVAMAAFMAFQQFTLTDAMVKAKLDAIANEWREEGLKQGRHIAFTYGDVELAGNVLSRYAVVHNVSLLLKQENGKAGTATRPNSLLLATPRMELSLGARSGGTLTLRFSQPVTVASEEAPNRMMLQVVGNAPLSMTFDEITRDNLVYTRWQQSLPEEMKITYLKEQHASGMEDETSTIVPVYQTMVLRSGAVEAAMEFAQNGSGAGQMNIAANDISLMPEGLPEGKITVNALRGFWQHLTNAENVPVTEIKFSVDTLNADAALISYAPVQFEFDAYQQGSMLKTTGPAAKPAGYQLRNFRLETKDAEVNAKADFIRNAGDTLPVGHASLNIKNAPLVLSELKRFGVLSTEDEPLLAAIMSRVSGTPYAEIKDLDVAINRPQGGAFTIGKATFEELFALVLSNKLQQLGNSDPALITPPASAPKLAPEGFEEHYGTQG